jgi:hypothetical protein
MKDRYYVQHLTRGVFLVRERVSQESTPGPDDRVIRAFDILHDADTYVRTVNATQRSLDEQFGPWVQDAAEQRSQK